MASQYVHTHKNIHYPEASHILKSSTTEILITFPWKKVFLTFKLNMLGWTPISLIQFLRDIPTSQSSFCSVIWNSHWELCSYISYTSGCYAAFNGRSALMGLLPSCFVWPRRSFGRSSMVSDKVQFNSRGRLASTSDLKERLTQEITISVTSIERRTLKQRTYHTIAWTLATHHLDNNENTSKNREPT